MYLGIDHLNQLELNDRTSDAELLDIITSTIVYAARAIPHQSALEISGFSKEYKFKCFFPTFGKIDKIFSGYCPIWHPHQMQK